MKLWINPGCSKCRVAVKELDAAGTAYATRRYLDDPPSVAEVEDVLGRLGLEPWDITRTGEAEAAEVKLLPRDAAHRADWVAALAAHPRLIQRPIITLDDGTAVVARDPETLARATGG
jgi:arsenate reductase